MGDIQGGVEPKRVDRGVKRVEQNKRNAVTIGVFRSRPGLSNCGARREPAWPVRFGFAGERASRAASICFLVLIL